MTTKYVHVFYIIIIVLLSGLVLEALYFSTTSRLPPLPPFCTK